LEDNHDTRRHPGDAIDAHYDNERVAIGAMRYKTVSLADRIDEVKAGLGKLNVNLKILPDVDGRPKVAQLVGYKHHGSWRVGGRGTAAVAAARQLPCGGPAGRARRWRTPSDRRFRAALRPGSARLPGLNRRMLMKLSSKTAVITGSTSGIGLAYARALAAEGANVMVNGFGRTEEIEAARADIEREFGVKALYSPADMTKPEQIKGMIVQAAGQLGGVDILINNAGIQHVDPIEDFPPEIWDRIIAINLSAAFHAIRAAVPMMKRAGWSRIISTASAHSLVASPFKSAYVTAKHGIAGLTKTVALELATHRITCNCISPGYVWTPLVESQIPDTMKARHLTREQVINDVLLHSQPTKEFVTSDQVAAVAVFLCSDAADQITGASISLDGGWTAE
jgi:3-hydroxybutyrate dehydrogenase